MIDEAYSDPRLACLYDLFWPTDSRRDFTFYLPLAMSAQSVLDVRCGTGALLHEVREAGHRGRLCGLDGAPGMLEVAKTRADIEWFLGDMPSAPDWHGEFDLALMTGHSFQTLVDDSEVHAVLTRIATTLDGEGSFVFETRNPLARDWEKWEGRTREAVGPDGAVVRTICEQVQSTRSGRVSFTETYASSAWDRPRRSRSTLRFFHPDELKALLSDAGLAVAETYGDWDRAPLAENSPEIIIVARPV